MNIFRTTALAFFLSISQLALAGEPIELFGKWKFQGPKAIVIWEFTTSTVSTTPFDATGKPLAEPNKANISYQYLNNNSWGINFKTADGKPGGGFIAIIKSKNTVVVDFPGAEAQTLSRE